MNKLLDEFTELEYKYDASNVKLSDFQKFIDGLKEDHDYQKLQEASSWDMYYVSSDNPNSFMRFRNGESPELTIKEKTVDSNNWERFELDLPLDGRRITEVTVDKFTSYLGYFLSRKIFKSCFIHWFNLVNYVYYTVYNDEMVEIGRYIEVEINKDKVPELQETAISLLKSHEKALAQLGLNHNNRMKRSLFEIYVK